MVSKTKFNSLVNFNNAIFIVVLVIIILIIVIILYKKYKTRYEGFEASYQPYNGGINKVDQILFINLDNRKDRLDAITKQLKSVGVDMEKVHRIPAHYTPGNGHLGCAKSHLDAIKYAQENNFENVLVFEDDFKFNTDLETTNQLFNDLFKVNVREWDIVMLSYANEKTKETKYPFLKKVLEASTSSGYIINKSYYQVLIKTFEKCVNNMSSERTSGVNWEQWALDQVWKENQKEDRWFSFNPLIGKQDDQLVSSIQATTNYNVKK
jgi:GR25 family glycosyltransferase involved in LPS biosynthesis